jgi:hypothetical protein
VERQVTTRVVLLTVVVLLLAGCSGSGSSTSARDRVLSTTAAKIQARRGHVVLDTYHGDGGFGGPRALLIVTLRAGTEADVAAQQSKDAVAAGYQQKITPACPQGCGFDATGSLPGLSVEIVPHGTPFRDSTLPPVPSGETGVIITLTYSG